MPLLNRLNRREFLLASSAAASAVVFAGCVPPPREMEAESRVLLAEDILSAYDNWYATTCRGCSAGCGALVRVVDGRARKVEGNPEHPLNAGKLCARGQAMVQEQYHPDRLRGPVARSGGGAIEPITWADALDRVVAALGRLQQQGNAGEVALITPPLAAHEAFLVDRFARAYGAQWLSFESISEAPLREAVRRVFGFDEVPRFDLANARTVLSFGADFLGSWLSPVRYGIDYGVFRQGSYSVASFQSHANGQPRGRLIHVDTHFSMTAASADEWVWVRPGTEGMLALSIAQAMGAAGLEAFAPEQTATSTAVSAEHVRAIAHELTANTPSLVIGGGSAGAYTQATETLSAILQLNLLLGNVGEPGGVLVGAPSPVASVAGRSAAASLRDWQDLVARMQTGQQQAVLVLGSANPVHGLPSALGFADALSEVPFVASFGSFGDDTTLLADLVLPSSLPLESWGDSIPSVGLSSSALSTQQPVVEALFDTRSVWDVLLAVADELGDPLRQALPWPTFKDLLQEELDVLRPDGTLQAQWWSQLLQHGVYGGTRDIVSEGQGGGAPLRPPQGLPILALPDGEFAGDAQDYPFNLVVFPHNTLGAGESAHLPWLQAAPDPVTSVTWQTWVEVNPTLATSLQVQEGDIVAIESPRGSVEVPVYISPAAPPEVLAMPLGQGHRGYGRWANARGADPMLLLDPLADAATGALAYGATRVHLRKTGRQIPIPKLEGMAPARQLPGQEVLRVVKQ